MITPVSSLQLKIIIVSVGYDDILRVTLPYALPWGREVVVATSPEDVETQRVVHELTVAPGLDAQEWAISHPYNPTLPRVSCHITDVFTRGEGIFNKGAAIEEVFQTLDHDGWFLLLDADIMLPSADRHILVHPSKLHGCRRRMLDDPYNGRWRQYKDPASWASLKVWPDPVKAGYFQLFHSSARPLQERPWYPLNCKHAGGCDAVFYEKFRQTEQRWFNKFECLHLGPNKTNWCGRASPRLDGLPVPDAEEAAAKLAFFNWTRQGKRGRTRWHNPKHEEFTP